MLLFTGGTKIRKKNKEQRYPQFQNAVGTLRAPNHPWGRFGDSGENVLSFYLFVTPERRGEWGFVYTQEQEQGFYPLFVL